VLHAKLFTYLRISALQRLLSALQRLLPSMRHPSAGEGHLGFVHTEFSVERSPAVSADP
jgi:hypothetical protein